MALPRSLVELVLAQSRTLASQRSRRVLGRRWTSQTSAATARDVQPFNWSVFSVESSEENLDEKTQLIKKLDEKNKQLSLDEKLDQLTTIALQHDPEVADTPELTDTELQSIYKDILSVPDNLSTTTTEQVKEAKVETNGPVVFKEELIPQLYGRLVEADVSTASDASIVSSPEALKASLPAILNAIEDQVASMEEIEKDLKTPKENLLPVMILTFKEWKDLVYACIELDDFPSLDMSLGLLRRYHGPSAPVFLDLLDVVFEHYAGFGYTKNFKHILDTYSQNGLTARQRHLVVKAHIHSGQVGPVQLFLYDLENKGTPAPLSAYSMVIHRLVFPHPTDNHSPDLILSGPTDPSTSTSKSFATQYNPNDARTSITRLHGRAQDLIAHMRFAAHPTPDLGIYTLAIQMCAIHPLGKTEPEKAMDLWYEMVNQSKIAPDVWAYNALIHALAKASTYDGKWGYEAWRVAREMLDSSRDAEGKLYEHLRPTSSTFEHLLELCKRTKDLGRCRWIMGEMMKEGVGTGKAMNHVFHCYAAYKPPVRREGIALVKQDHAEGARGAKGEERSEDGESSEEIEPINFVNDFHRVPQTAKEVVSEAQAIFEAILSKPDLETPPAKPKMQMNFGSIPLKSDLVTAYLAVHANHSLRYEFPKLWLDTWKRVREGYGDDGEGLMPNSKAYALGMEWCARMPPAGNVVKRMMALRMAKVLMREWVAYERENFAGDGGKKKEAGTLGIARRIERIWAAYIKVLALNDRTDEGLTTVYQFFKRYPPKNLRKPSPIEAYDSPRTVLISNKPLVRMTAPHEVGDDTIAPMLTFREVEVLHSRLVTKEDVKGIKSLTYVVESYKGSLRMRRKKGLTATAPSHPSVRVGSITPPKDRRPDPTR